MEEDLGPHEFGNNNGCYGSTGCDWGCSCNHDECLWCRATRTHGSGDKEGEICPKNTKEARDARAAREAAQFKLDNPDVPAVKGTHLLKTSMADSTTYIVADFLSVPDCESDGHEK